jgi:hypothetical protein
VATGEQEVHRDRVGDLPAEPHRRAPQREEAPARLGDAELRALPRDADVGALEDLGPAGDGRPLDGCDQRLLQALAPEEGPPVEVRVALEPRRPFALRPAAGHGLEVAARAEVPAGAREDRDADLLVLLDLDPCVRQADEHLRAEGVSRLGPVEDDRRDVALLPQDDVGFGPVGHGWAH